MIETMEWFGDWVWLLLWFAQGVKVWYEALGGKTLELMEANHLRSKMDWLLQINLIVTGLVTCLLFWPMFWLAWHFRYRET